METLPDLDTTNVVPIRADLFDALGTHLGNKFTTWADARKEVESEWLKDLRAFNGINEPDIPKTNHNHLYFGIIRTKCLVAFARLTDLIFHSGEKSWSASPTPVPSSAQLDEMTAIQYMDKLKICAEKMQEEMEDQLVEAKFDDMVKAAVLESCIIGTGVVKGTIPGVKITQNWQNLTGSWQVVDNEKPFPEFHSVSAFDFYPDPYATLVDNMTGAFERHVMIRREFEALRDNPQFNTEAIDEIIRFQKKGNHTPLDHENQRRAIAGISNATGVEEDRFDVLEYWGQVTGDLLLISNIPEFEGMEIDEYKSYWVNCWVCQNRTLLAKIMPLAKQRIPYNLFIYAKVPHQLWGVGVAKLGRDSAYAFQGVTRALLDNISLSSLPQTEVNINMLKDGEKADEVKAGKVWLRDGGSPDTPAVRFYYPPSQANEFMTVADQFKSLCEDETGLPNYTGGTESTGANQTASGMSMLMASAQVSIKNVIKNFEDYGLRPLLTSLFDWNMSWNDRPDVKGDMDIEIRISSAVIAKETQSSRLIQYLQLTNNPMDAQFVDRQYLLRETASAFDIDAEKAVPELQDADPMQQQLMLSNPQLAGQPQQMPGAVDGMPQEGVANQVLPMSNGIAA